MYVEKVDDMRAAHGSLLVGLGQSWNFSLGGNMGSSTEMPNGEATQDQKYLIAI